MFYAPCQAADPTASFFHDYNELPRAALDVDQWIADAPSVAVVTLQAPSVLAQVDREAVDQAITAWRSSPAGSGHKAFFALAMQLKRAGMSPSEMEALLTQEAQYAHSPSERHAEIPGLVATCGIDPRHAAPSTKQAAYRGVLG